MALSTGTRIGAYEVLAKLGEGGMGEVYRARDTKLDRDVALKILPESFAHDPDRLTRFEREAKALAALNHPHIAQIHGLESSSTGSALVMELVEGEDLAARLARGPMALDDALPIARQIASALEAAHEAGIVHRDLKPANVKLRADGTVKVLDFGLAKQGSASTSGVADVLGASGAVTSPAMTMQGAILGTAAYMSPEQAKGKPVDRRADIWAFGAVLFEMLAGARPFAGDDATDTIASVLRSDPNWQSLPADVPVSVRTLIRRCLEKDPGRRPSHMSVVSFLLADSSDSQPSGSAPPSAVTQRDRRRLVAATAGALVVGSALTGAITWWLMSSVGAAAPEAPIRFTMAAETGGDTWRISTDRPFALSPDGRAIAYRTGGDSRPQLVIRTLDRLEPRVLVDGVRIRWPFFSPDGQWVGFFAGTELRKIRVAGGTAVTITRFSSDTILGASWGDDDSIVFALGQPSSPKPFAGLLVVPASGGEPKVLTTVEPDRGELAHIHPSALPNSRGVMFHVRLRGRQGGDGQLVVLDRASGERREIAPAGSEAAYVPGHVVYADPQGTLQSLSFDLSRLTPSGFPTPLAERVYVPAVGAPSFSAAVSGALAFVPALDGPSPESARSIVWVDRQGREEPVAVPPRAYAAARLSPDGRRIALDIRDEGNDVWIWSIDRGALTRLTSGPTLDFGPIWTPDGRRIIWSSTRQTSNPRLYSQAADGTGAAEPLTTDGVAVFPGAVTPDGQSVLFYTSGNVIQRLHVAEAGRVDTVLDGSSLLSTPEMSPDGRWLAYQSNESGAAEIYARPYPNVDGGRWQISTQGGTRPVWSRNGRELFFLDAQGRLSVVPVTVSGETLVPGTVQRLLDTAYYPGFTTRGFNLRGYDVSPDGQRFLMIKRNEGTADQRSVLTIVLNWPQP